jgi:L-seryl-tRNA(Ser) seleniumtransferase
MSHPIHDAMRAIPAVESLLGEPVVAERASRLPAPLVLGLVRSVLDEIRSEVRLTGRPPERTHIVAGINRRLDLYIAGRPARIVNATGIVLHTNLGRAVLGERVAKRLSDVAAGYCDLEHNLESGGRGRREHHVEELLRAATGAEAAIVVNNCAAAMLLLLDTFGRDREVVISRGELVEIGGSFRMPDVLERSGGHMMEVGTTNKTRVEDYRAAISPETSVLLKVHTSNFRVMGFTEEASTAELAALAAENPGVVVIWDLGSGALGRTESPVPDEEPTMAEMLRAGAHLVAASGDKLLGGPQAGLIVGRRELVARAVKNPLYRALRPDKLTLAALSEVLLVHLSGNAAEDVPALRMMHATIEELEGRARTLASELDAAIGSVADIDVIDGKSEMGGGTLPVAEMPTKIVTVAPRNRAAHRVEERLRAGHPAVLVRVQDGRLHLDPRTILDNENEIVVDRFTAALDMISDGDREGGHAR